MQFTVWDFSPRILYNMDLSGEAKTSSSWTLVLALVSRNSRVSQEIKGAHHMSAFKNSVFQVAQSYLIPIHKFVHLSLKLAYDFGPLQLYW